MMLTSGLFSVVSGCNIAGAGLNTQQGRWTKHPQTALCKEQLKNPLISISRNPFGLCVPVWGHGSGAKRLDRKSPAAPLFFAALFCGCSIHLCTQLQRAFIMIYSFLIAPQALRVSELNRIRTVSCYARNLKQARASFAGLSVALLSRMPAGGQANV